MALNPQNAQHAIQIQAGILGRNAGHRFEIDLTDRINNLPMPFAPVTLQNLENHLFIQSPEISLLRGRVKCCGNEFIAFLALSSFP